jgi:hypothetical protein
MIFFTGGARQRAPAERKEIIDRTRVLPVSRQVKLRGINCSSVYYLPGAVGGAVLASMRCIDGSRPEHPFAGARRWIGCCGARDLSAGAST